MFAAPPLARAERHWLSIAALDVLLITCALWSSGAVHGAADDSVEGNDSIENCHKPLCWKGSSLNFDLQSNHLDVPDFQMVDTARSAHIKADRAERSGDKADNSTWVLTGHVQISVPQGRLSADRATMQVVNNHILTMTAQGSPAQFEHNADGAAPSGPKSAAQAAAEHAHGHAREIVYDLDRDEIQLNGDSWLTDGCYYVLSSQHISYDIANQKVRADPSDGTGVTGSMVRQRQATGCPASVQ